ncbi:MAG: rhodanese-like domain-containing protein [Pseudomonadota bacterium]
MMQNAWKLSLTVLLLSGTALAQNASEGTVDDSSFQEDSFEEGSFEEASPEAESADDGSFAEDSFSEGSFEEGSFEDANVDTPASDETASDQASAGFEDGFDQGSFDNPTDEPVSDIPVNPPPVPGDEIVPAARDDGLPENPIGGDLPPPPPPPPADDTQTTSTGDDVLPPPPPPPPPDDDTPSVVSDEGGSTTVVEDDVVTPPEPDDRVDDVTGPKTKVDPWVTAFETRDFGVPPQDTLRETQFHAPTPTAIPGAQLVTTAVLVSALESGTQVVLIDVLGGDYTLPGAYSAPALASGGSFQDRTQQQAAIWLEQITKGDTGVPVVVFCSDPMCWLGYNATLRTVAAGFTNVYWYRGGLKAWQMAGLPMRPAAF